MKKGQRPSRHYRSIKTKKGRKTILVNPKVLKKKKRKLFKFRIKSTKPKDVDKEYYEKLREKDKSAMDRVYPLLDRMTPGSFTSAFLEQENMIQAKRRKEIEDAQRRIAEMNKIITIQKGKERESVIKAREKAQEEIKNKQALKPTKKRLKQISKINEDLQSANTTIDAIDTRINELRSAAEEETGKDYEEFLEEAKALQKQRDELVKNAAGIASNLKYKIGIVKRFTSEKNISDFDTTIDELDSSINKINKKISSDPALIREERQKNRERYLNGMMAGSEKKQYEAGLKMLGYKIKKKGGKVELIKQPMNNKIFQKGSGEPVSEPYSMKNLTESQKDAITKQIASLRKEKMRDAERGGYGKVAVEKTIRARKRTERQKQQDKIAKQQEQYNKWFDQYAEESERILKDSK